MRMISSGPDEISNEFMKVFDSLVSFYSLNKKVSLTDQTVESAITLGSFGKSLKERRLSVYFCSGLIRVLESPKEEFINRIMILSSSQEKLIKAEVVHSMRYIFPFLDEDYVKKNFLKTVSLDNLVGYLPGRRNRIQLA